MGTLNENWVIIVIWWYYCPTLDSLKIEIFFKILSTDTETTEKTTLIKQLTDHVFLCTFAVDAQEKPIPWESSGSFNGLKWIEYEVEKEAKLWKWVSVNDSLFIFFGKYYVYTRKC